MTTSTSLSRSYADPADRETLERAADALRAHGIDVRIISAGAAPSLVDELIPDGAVVYTTTSKTLDELGISAAVRAATRYDATRRRTETLDPATQASEFRRLVSTMDVVVGSVHAVTEDGRVVVASFSGSQLASYAFGADRVVWVVGAQKVVPDLATALDRIETHCLPLESERLQQLYGIPSAVAKELIVTSERPGRITVLLLDSALGF